MLFKTLRLYADLNVHTVLIEESHQFLDVESLDEQGLIDALICFKYA